MRRPASRSSTAAQRRAGLQELGLPYATDAAVTRHLARFIGEQPWDERYPTAVLYNGGVMNATPLRERLTDVVGSWSGRRLRQASR